MVAREGENSISPGCWSRLRNGRWSGIAQTENTVRHTKYGRITGMVVGESGRSTGVLLYHQPMCLSISFAGGRKAVHQCDREPPTDGAVLHFESEDASTSGGEILICLDSRFMDNYNLKYTVTRIEIKYIKQKWTIYFFKPLGYPLQKH